jgi:hypothetical protein
MLVAGFVLQLLATLKVTLDSLAVVILWVALAAVPLGYFLLGRARLVVRFMKQASAGLSGSA